MDLTYRIAGIEDLELLVETRVEVLRAANCLGADADMAEVARASRSYYQKALPEGSHTAILVFDGDAFVAAGGVSYYSLMPTYHNPAGRKAYIMNMYTRPAWRRQGVATRVLDLLVQDAHASGVTSIALEATPAGRPLYEKCGFTASQTEMELPE